MKIAYDAKRFYHNTSGLGNYSRDLVRILASYFPDNKYVLLSKNRNDRAKDIEALPNVNFSPISKGKFSRQLKMGKDAQQLQADIFHGLSGEIPFKWNQQPIKKVLTIHDLIFERYPQFYSFFDRKIHFWKFKKSANLADVVIAISEQTKRDIIQYLKISEDKIKVVYQGCHAAFKLQYSEDLKAEVTAKYQLPPHFILNVGTIEERKNLLAVVKALHGTDIPLVVVGKKTKYYQQIEKYISKYQMKTQIQFLEGVNMDDLAVIYQLADIFIYPSLFEGFGIPVIEAHFSKTAVITSNVSCLPEAGGPDALYVNPLDETDIRAKIKFLWSNESERLRRAEKSAQFAQDNFSDAIIARNLTAIYNELFN